MPPIVTKSAARVAAALRAGGLAAIPTETVYGLAADARNPAAVAAIYRIKNRPRDHPVIVHLLDFEAVSQWADAPAAAQALARAFWPGPLTLALPRKGEPRRRDNARPGWRRFACALPRILWRARFWRAAAARWPRLRPIALAA